MPVAASVSRKRGASRRRQAVAGQPLGGRTRSGDLRDRSIEIIRPDGKTCVGFLCFRSRLAFSLRPRRQKSAAAPGICRGRIPPRSVTGPRVRDQGNDCGCKRLKRGPPPPQFIDLPFTDNQGDASLGSTPHFCRLSGYNRRRNPKSNQTPRDLDNRGKNTTPSSNRHNSGQTILPPATSGSGDGHLERPQRKRKWRGCTPVHQGDGSRPPGRQWTAGIRHFIAVSRGTSNRPQKKKKRPEGRETEYLALPTIRWKLSLCSIGLSYLLGFEPNAVCNRPAAH